MSGPSGLSPLPGITITVRTARRRVCRWRQAPIGSVNTADPITGLLAESWRPGLTPTHCIDGSVRGTGSSEASASAEEASAENWDQCSN